MAEAINGIRFRGAALYLFLALTVIFARMLPLGFEPGRLPGPDILLVLTIVWTIRRPEDLPPGLIAVTFLFADLLLMRPPGLMALLALLGTEFLRSRSTQTNGAPFAVEWLIAAVLIAGIMILYYLSHFLFALPVPRLGLYLFSVVISAASYPFLAAILRWGFGIRRPGAEDSIGKGGQL